MCDVAAAAAGSPGLVLIHGGGHAADCWDLVVEAMSQRAPDLRVVAVDLPGRPASRRPIGAPTVDDAAEAVVEEVEHARLDSVVLVGHSLGGVVALTAAAKLGHPRVKEIVLIAAAIPGRGSAAVDTMPAPMAWIARRRATKGGASISIPGVVARHLFWNGLSPARREYARSRLYSEPAQLFCAPVDYVDLPMSTPRTWILTLRDRMISERRQRASMARLYGMHLVLSIDSCHDVMFSEPDWLAEQLMARCRRTSRTSEGR